MFAYCNNNPVNMVDSDGEAALAIPLIFPLLEDVFLFLAYTTVGVAFALVSWNTCKVLYPLAESLVFNPGLSSQEELKQAITDRLERTYVPRSYRTEKELHHIVAKADLRASAARRVLRSVGIDVNNPLNLISIKTSLHRRLHTNMYFALINQMICSAYNSANGDIKQARKNVVIALAEINAFLLTLDELTPS